MAGNDYGGRMTVKLSSGEIFSLRGTFNVMSSGFSAEAITNQDRSVDRTLTPKAATCEINFADKGINYNQLMQSDRFNVTIDEDNTDVSHYFTGAFFVGDPSVNRITGEVTGLTITAEKYRRRG
jgi:Phage tail tube protein